MSSEYEPRLTGPLKPSYKIREGHPVKLSCRFDAYPEGNIEWLKDGIPIDFEALGISRDFKVVKEVNYTALLIKEAFPEDAGSYTVVISNSLGEARSYTQLIVEEYFCRTPESEMSDTPLSKPNFVQSLRDTTINEGEKLKLHAAINAHPEPEIIWYRNNIPLKNSLDLMLTFDGQLCTLIKNRCEKENDTGIYRITAVNSMGQAESTCQVVVQSNVFHERLQSTRSLPVFTQSLEDKTICEGEKLLFQIRINGQPKPQVIWYKDNQPLRNTNDYNIRTENDIYIFEIPRVSINHAGFYQVKAINMEGESKCSARINILPKMIIPQPMIIESNGYPPEFLQLFNDKKTSIGSTIKFEARLIGTQPLNVYWLFNGSPITRLENNQHYQQHIFNDTYTLTINNVRYDDIGKYSLNAENSWGKATCTAELFIPPRISKIGSSPSSSSSLVQVRTVTRRTTASGNSDNSRGTDNSKNMLSNLLVKMSPSPPSSRKRQLEINQQLQQGSSSTNTRSYEQESSFISSNNNKRSRPLQSQSLTRHEDHRRIQQYPRTLEIFIPTNTNEKETTITQSYEYERRRSLSENSKQPRRNDLEIANEYLRCLDDLTDEYENLKRHKKSFDNQKKKTTENYESIEKISRHQPIQIENTYQRSLSESLIYKRLKPIIRSDFTLSEDELFNMEYRLKHKERLKPIRIHSSTNSIPGETSIKYVHTERAPVEVLVPKPQILTRQGEHSSTIVKDTRHLSRKITTNIHQQPRRRTIEGQHELRIIEQPIKSNRTRKVEFTIPKPIENFPAEHSSTFLVKSRKGGRFHTIDISKSLTHERTIPGEHELRVISQPIKSNLYNKPVELLFPKPNNSSSSSSSHHSSTIVKQNRTPKSSFIFDNIQTKIKGEHELRFIDKPIESGQGNSVELILPKNVMDTAEHTTTIVTETQPNRRVLEITGSGKKMESEHERKYFHDTVRIEEELEVKLPKQKYEQAEHSATIIKHSRGKGPIIEIDTTQRKIQGEHETKIFEDFIETKADEMQLLIAKPKIPAKHSTTVIKGQRGKLQTYAIDRTQPIPGEYQTKYYDQPIESYSEMEVLFSKQQPQQQPVVGEHMSTLIKNVHSKQLVYGDHRREIPGEHVLTIVEESDRKINKKNENEVEFIVPKPQKKNFIDHYQSSSDYDERFVSSEYEEEEKTSGEHTTTYLKQARAKYEAIELVVDRPKQLPSISTLIADIQPETQITSIKPTKILLSEDSSVKLDMELNNKNFYEQFNEMEIVLEKPLVRDSSTTLIANIQPGLELKSIQPTQQIRKSIEESSSTFTLQREQQTKEEENLLEFQIRKPYIQDSSSTLLANVQSELGIQGQLKPSPYIPQIIEDSSSALTMNLNTNQQITPFELIIPRIDVESSTSTIIAQVAPTIAGLRTKVDVPQVEKSTSSFLLEQKKRLDQEIELIIPKPKHIETSTSTMLADIEGKLETKDIHSTQIQPETSTSTFLFEEIRQYVIPQPVEIRMKQPTIADSSTTLLANVKATLDTQQIQRLGNLSQPFEHSSSAILFETKIKNIQPSEVELILPRPQIQESTSVLLAEIRPTLDTSQTHMVIPPSLQSPVKSSSQFILETEKLETIPVELHLHRQPSSHTLLANINDTRKKNKDIYVLGTDYQQEQQQYGTSTLHADLNKPVELIFNVDEGNTPSISQQYQRNYNTRMLTNTTGGIDNSSTLISELEGRQYQPIEFVVSGSGSGGLTGYSNTMDQYSTGTGGYKTTTTTTKRKITSSDTGGYNETTNRSVIRGIRPYDQVDLVLQPDSLTSSSKVLTTSFGLDQGHSPYFSLALHDQTAREGESVLFEVIVSAQPSAEIIWDKNGELIGDESAFRIDYYGNGRATLYIPEAFLDDQGYYTCTATNTLGTCRTTSRLTIDSIGEGISPKRRQLNGSSAYYQQGPTQTIESYRIYSQPTTVTQVTEETQVYQIPGHQKQQQNEITYSIHGTQPKFQPVSFLVSSSQENTVPTTTTITTDEDQQSLAISPYQIFGTKLHTQPNQSSVPSYGDETSTTTTTTTMYSQQQQQQPRNTGLIATVAKQAGPTYSYYQQPLSHESDSMQTESETSTVNFTRSSQQPPTSYITSRPNFTKPLAPIDALEGGTVQITVHLTSFGPQQTRPQIEWYHHAQPIVSDNQHYRITEEYDTSTLEIINVKKEDTGQVWCVANTPAGSATTTCTINIRENSARTHYLTSSQQQVVPQETVYTTQSTHSAHAQIPLHHQQPEQRIPSQYYSTQTITQQQISPQSYTSQTAQDQVSPQSYTSFSTQQPKQQAPFQPYISQEQPQTSSPQSYASFSTQQPKQQAPFQPYALQEQPQTSSPQSFIPQAPPLLPNFNTGPKYSDQQIKILNNGLQNQPLNTGSETVFECQFSGQPDKIQWFRNDVEIVNNLQQLNNRIYHITNLTNGTSRLIIKTTLEEDIGTYSVKLTGPNVEETSNAKLLPASQFQNIQKKKVEQEQRKALVQELEEKQLKRMKPTKTAAPRGSFTYGTSDDEVFLDTTQRTSPYRQPTVPTISRPLKDLDVKEGQPIQLTCQVQGFPKSELFWFKNNIPLPLSARHKMAYDAGGGNITLRINDSRPEDSGLYTVIAKNPQGHVQTSAHVDVQETPGIDETSYVQPDAFKYIEKQPTAPRSNKPRRESDTTNLQQQKPAKILKTPMNTSVVEGAPAQFTCQVEGNPKPKIAWLKDNKPLMSGTRFSTYFDQASKTAVLRINDVCKEDQGYYTCIVDNVLNSDRSTATLQVIPESKIDQRSYVETDSFKYLTPENKIRLANKENERRTSGVDSESFVSPDAFRYLEAKKPLKTIDDNLTIDDRPIVDLDAFRYLEARQAPKGKRDDIARASIDDTPIIAPDAFRYLERKADAAKLKKDNDTGPSIDETPQVNLSAFQYLERKEIPKKPEGGPSIDESSIVNPEAFKYLERKPTKKPEDVGPLIDESPMVNPDAFRYLERQVAPKLRDTGPTIDTTPMVNPEVFKYLERPSEMPRIDEGPAIDTRPIVPQEAFRWLDRPKQIDRKPEGPSIDESPYVNPQAFRYIEAKPKPKVIDQGPSIDESSYVNPQAFRYLEAAPSKKPVDKGPTIDTSTYVNPQLFAQFEEKSVSQTTHEDQEITRAPRVIQPLRSTQTLEGKPIALVAIVDGYPVPQLTWLKDGAELPASNRVTTNYDIPSKTAWIRIDSVRTDDSSVYTLMAHNTAGEVRSDARLNVVPSMTPIDDTAFVPAEAFERIERAIAPNRGNIPATTGVDDTAFVNPELFQQFELPLKQPRSENFTDELVIQVPARIIAPLKSIQAPESVTVILDAIVEGSPIPTFTWLKDQIPLSESNRFITNYDLPSKRVTLTIKDVRENDTGTYTLLASNGPQIQHSSATLQIIGAPSIDQSSFIPMDVFRQLEYPQNQQRQIPVQSGVDQTSYISQPDRFAVFDQIQPHRRPLNDFGGVDETSLVSMEKIRLLEIPSNAPKQPYDVEEKLQVPTVLTPLQPIDTQEGNPVVLTAKIEGSPIPNFTWFKDNTPLVASSRFTTYYDIPSKLIVLQINDARPNDTGVYTVRADNKAGDVETSSKLNVSSLPSIRDQSFIPTDKFRLLEQGNQPRFIEEISGVDERPLVDLTKLRQLEIKPNQIFEVEDKTEQYKTTILIPLRNVNAVENQPVVLSAQIEGKPQPQFTWFKNDQPLSEGNRFRTHYDIPSKTIFLTIAGAREDDSGTYRLVAKNPIGEEETSCQVTVDINQPNIDQRSFVPQTAFDKLEKPLLKLNNITSGVDQTSFFNQDLFRPFDERHIKHPSAIVGGEDSDAAMPVSAPKILQPLRPIQTSEGDTVLLTTQVEGYPLPQFTWIHNNQPIMASNRITPHYDMLTKRCYLQIFDSRPNDSGTYELLAENPAGQDRTKTELTIVPVSKIDQTGYVPYDKFSTLEFKPRIPSDLRSGVDATPFVSGEIFRLLEAKPINEQFIPEDEQNVPLEVLVPLKPAVAQEGQPVILTTRIRGRPIPEFTWLRNNQPLMESNRFQTHYDFPSETLVLEISDIWPHDSGTYTVIAEKPKTGERVQTSAPLTVRTDTTSIDHTAFVAPDAFRTLEAGPNLRTIMVESGVDTNSFLTPDVLRALDQVKPKPTDVQEKEQPLMAPKVIVPLQPINCNEGQPINFTAKIQGNPQPTFTWFKNGQPLQESNRFWSHYDVPSKTVLLQINSARPDDSGTYTLVAQNPLGKDQTQTNVNVSFGPRVDTNAFVPPEKFAAFDQPYGRNVPTQSGVDTTPFVQPERFAQLELKAPIPTKEDMEQMEGPKVITPLQSVQVNEGSPVLLQATVVGKPTPNFVWLKDNAPLAASNRLRTRYDIGTKQVLLQINDARPQDIGEYLVIATNPAGEDSTVCSLSVLPDKPGVDDRAFVPTDKFRNLERPEGQARRPLEIIPGVDIQPFVSPDKFRNLDHVPLSTRPGEAEIPEEKRPPRVIQPLSNSDLEELMPVLLTTTIDAGSPMATFTWFKNGQPLLEGNRFTTKYDILTKTLTLQILAARPDDQGTYTVRATNPTGTDETTCKLTIRPVASIDTRSFVQPERFAPLEVKAPIPKKEDLEQMQPPKVIVPLQSEQVDEGAPVLLQATVVGKPTPNFVWLKDGAPLAASNRLRTRYDISTKQVLLQINDARPQDIGEYLVIATNPAGEDSTVGSLKVIPDKPGVDDRAFFPTENFRNLERPEGQARRPLEIIPGVDIQPFISPDKFRNLDHVPSSTRPGEEEIPEEKRPPRVIVPLSDCVLEELMPVIFTTNIDAGVPMASFTWLKNGQPLLEGNRFTTKYDILTKTLTLQIIAARPDDQGVYTVRATNPVGRDETTCKLTIQPVASIDTRPFIQPEHFAPLEVKAPAPKKEDLEQMQPPKVIVPLQSEQVNEGAPVLLQATIVGKPTPNFVWLKDGAPLAASNRLRTRYDIGSKQVLLQINDVRPQDVGEYLVIATNPAGEDSTVCSLSVLPDKPGVDDRAFVPTDKFRNLEHPEGQPRPLEIIPGVDIQPFISPDKFRKLNQVPPSTRPGEGEVPEEKRPPRVIVPLIDYVLEELMPVIFTTTIDAGAPMASFTWLKNGQPLLEGNRFTTKYDILTKILTLQIIAARPDDQGVYTVHATNPVGRDETTCKLTIQPVASIDTRPFVQPEHFAPLEVKAPAPKKEDLEKMQPPKVIIPLQSEQVKEGTPVLLQATIIGKPTPNFVWLKDGAPLAASNRLRTRYDIGSKQVLLQIEGVRPQDVGEYLVIATNPAGEDSTVCSLSVLPDKPGVDDRAFVPTDKFRNLERPEGQARRPLEIVPDKIRKLNQVPPSTKTGEGEVPEEMRPPRVIVPLSDCDLEELMPVLLTATIDAGVPIASFTWLKNNQPLLEGNRFTTKYDIVNRIITLQILASRPDDQGVYTVRATNPVGSDETTCKLTIRPVSSVDTRPFVDAERFRPFDHRPTTAGNLDNEGQPLRPPKVLVPMNNVRLTEYQPIVLKSIIDAGYPMGTFTWLKDGRPIPESNRYRANFDINTRTASLFIDAARPATDTGRYTVHVENIVGKDQTIGEVLVEGTPAIDDRPFIEPSKFGKFEAPLRVPTTGPRGPILQPDDSLRGRENLAPWIRLIKGLEDQLIDETKAAQLVCVVDAHPPATINWFKDGQPLMVSQRFMPDYDHKTGIVRLTIYPVNAADSGQYTMVARNIAGEVSTKCKLRIQPTASVEENPLVKFAGLRKTPQHPSGLGPEPSHKPVDSEDGQKPYFIKIPVDQEVPEGQLVRLDYIPAGRPEPSLTWYRNGIPLRPDDADHRDVVNEGGVHSLLIRNPQLGPTVEYTCVAKNKFGEAPFTVHLSVVERGSNIAPYFIEQLYNIIIIEGQDARLDASAQGFPEPKVTWEKEGKPLTPNKEYKVEFEGAKTTLYIRGAKMTDAGWYQCTATSPAGTAITKCKVTVIPLSEAGQYAKDLPQFGPQQLAKLPGLPEEDIRSKYMTVPIKPPDVKPEELYKLPKRLKKMDSIPEDVKRRGVKVLPDEVLAALQKNLEEFPEEEMYSKDRPQPPKFKVHIKSHLNLNEDDQCLFEAKLIPVRDPMMRVQWFKNGKVLHSASRIIPRYDFADVSLEFLYTFAEDDGIYECVATNPYGEDRTRAELKCRPKRSIIYNTQLPEGMEGVSKLQMLEDEIRYTASMIGLEEKVQEKEPKAPEFIMPLEDISVDEGDNAKFIAKVDGHPRPRITWSINDSDIANGSRYKLVFDGLVHYLDIPKTRQYDAGIVRCIAKNSLGQTESVASLNLRFRLDYRSALSKASGSVETGLDDSFDVDIEERLRLRSQLRQRESIDDRARRPSTDKPIHPLHSKAIDRLSWRQTVEKVGDAPNFTKPLLPLKAKEGSKVVVSVEFTGDPPPTVSWYRDGFMVEDSEDFKIHTTSTQSILTIKHAFIIDSGLYTIKLFNPIGIRQCQAAIRIVPIIAEDQTPRFLDVPQDSEILAGDPVRFQCRVEGEPFPTVAFYREDEPVNLNDKRFRVIQENDVFTLLLFEALPADSGQYEAVAENSVGKANTRFTLIVTPRVPGGKKASIIDDPKLIHKVPYLEKPLEDLHVKEGQSATFECIIPASFGSDVKWYKGTSEWQIKPSKFFKPKSDGTKHQLFILEAYAEDEGLYKCVVSNPVGTTATTATLKVDHTTHVPEFIHGFSNLTTYEGEQVRFEVEVRGDPPPTISWFRDGEIIRDSPDFQIFTEGNRSLFYISEVFMEDQGLFTCTASNSAGSSDCSARLIVEPRPQL